MAFDLDWWWPLWWWSGGDAPLVEEGAGVHLADGCEAESGRHSFYCMPFAFFAFLAAFLTAARSGIGALSSLPSQSEAVLP